MVFLNGHFSLPVNITLFHASAELLSIAIGGQILKSDKKDHRIIPEERLHPIGVDCHYGVRRLFAAEMTVSLTLPWRETMDTKPIRGDVTFCGLGNFNQCRQRDASSLPVTFLESGKLAAATQAKMVQIDHKSERKR
jgi:hypothetical protein